MEEKRTPDAFPTRGGAEPTEGTDEPTTGGDLDESRLSGDAGDGPGFDPERVAEGAGVPQVDALDPEPGGGRPPSGGRDAPQGGLGT